MMDELGIIWNSHEGIEELKQKLLYMGLELEAVRIAAGEDAQRHKESSRHLLCLLKTASQERDEARVQLQKLLGKLVVPTSTAADLSPLSPVFNQQAHVDNPLMILGKTNSGLAESRSLSLSHGSSPASSFLDSVSSPELSNTNNAVVDSGGSISLGLPSRGLDVGLSTVDDLARGRSLPQKGNLLQAVMDVGPLLQTLLVAGPLPRWRNPPPLQQFKIRPMATGSYKPHMCSSALINFGNGSNFSQPWSEPWLVPSVSGSSGGIPAAKRQRLH